MPAMSKKDDNDVIPVQNSSIVIHRDEFYSNQPMLDHAKIFDKRFSDVKLVTNSEDDENLPDKWNTEFIIKYEYGHLTDKQYFTKEEREKRHGKYSYQYKNERKYW